MNGSGRILVVDDEPQIRRVMKTALTAHGYEAYEARSGEEALDGLRECSPDLILLDMNMPGMGGMAACRSIRAISETPIIVLSVRDREQDKIAALDAGADDYVTKPFSVNELMARIRANLRRTPWQADSEGPLVLSERLKVDFGARQVIANGREVRLTPKEFDLLHYFVANANKPITHRKLLQTYATRLATALASLVSVLDPELVVLSGASLTSGGEVLRALVQAELEELAASRPRLVVGDVREHPVLRGALESALATTRDEVFDTSR